MKVYWRSGCIDPRILGLGTRWLSVDSFTSRPLYTNGKSSWYPLDRRLGGRQSRSGRGGEEKNSQLLPGLKPPIIQPVAQRYNTDISYSKRRYPVICGSYCMVLCSCTFITVSRYRVQNGSGTHPASYPMGTRGSFPRDKAAWA